jgi:hypothetical protein
MVKSYKNRAVTKGAPDMSMKFVGFEVMDKRKSHVVKVLTGKLKSQAMNKHHHPQPI